MNQLGVYKDHAVLDEFPFQTYLPYPPPLITTKNNKKPTFDADKHKVLLHTVSLRLVNVKPDVKIKLDLGSEETMDSCDLRCEVTEYMDKFRDPKQIPGPEFNWVKTYIMSKNGKPEIGEYFDPKDKENFYFWWVRIPGYTCAYIVFNRKDDTVAEILMIDRGGDETMYLNPVKLQKELNEKFVGKKLTCWTDDSKCCTSKEDGGN